MLGFENKCAIIFGGGSVGAATARMLAEGGANVAIADLEQQYAEAAAEGVNESGRRSLAIQCDISSADSVAAAVAAAAQAFGSIDLMHVNAADTVSIFKDSDAVSVPDEIIDRTIDVNMRGPLNCVRAVIPEMLKRGGGSIVFTTAEAAYIWMDHAPLYAMTKATLHPLARHIAAKWGKQGIRANCVSPGLIMSDRARLNVTDDYAAATLAGLRVPRLGEPSDIAAAAVYFLSDRAGYVNGQVLSVSGGEYHH